MVEGISLEFMKGVRCKRVVVLYQKERFEIKVGTVEFNGAVEDES